MRIQVINPNTKQFIEFYDSMSFNKYLGIPEPYKQAQVNTEGKYAIQSYSGVQGLPQNNNISNRGIDQDGDTFLSNNYSSRQIIIDYYAYDTFKMSQILYMDNHLLDVKIITDYGTYNTRGYVVGRYDGGSLELSCDPFYTLDGERVYIQELALNNEGKPFLPITMPRIWFDGVTDRVTFPLEIGIHANPTIQMTGKFKGVTIRNDIGNQLLILDDIRVESSLIIRLDPSGAMEILVDGNISNTPVRGLYVELFNGRNTLSVRFDTRETDVTIRVSYMEVTSYVR